MAKKTTPNIKRRWTPAELRKLKRDWGTVPIDNIAKALNRSMSATSAQAKHQRLGSPNAGHDFLSLAQVMKLTGCWQERILNAAAHLQIKLQRLPRNQTRLLCSKRNRRRYAITPQQCTRIAALLRMVPDGRRITHPLRTRMSTQ